MWKKTISIMFSTFVVLMQISTCMAATLPQQTQTQAQTQSSSQFENASLPSLSLSQQVQQDKSSTDMSAYDKLKALSNSENVSKEASSWLKTSLDNIDLSGFDLSQFKVLDMPDVADSANLKYVALQNTMTTQANLNKDSVSVPSSAMDLFTTTYGDIDKYTTPVEVEIPKDFNPSDMLASFNTERASAYQEFGESDFFKEVSGSISIGNVLSLAAEAQAQDHTISTAAISSLLSQGDTIQSAKANNAYAASLEKVSSYGISNFEVNSAQSTSDANALFEAAKINVKDSCGYNSMLIAIGSNENNKQLSGEQDVAGNREAWEAFVRSDDYSRYQEYESSGGTSMTEEDYQEMIGKYSYFTDDFTVTDEDAYGVEDIIAEKTEVRNASNSIPNTNKMNISQSISNLDKEENYVILAKNLTECFDAGTSSKDIALYLNSQYNSTYTEGQINTIIGNYKDVEDGKEKGDINLVAPALNNIVNTINNSN